MQLELVKFGFKQRKYAPEMKYCKILLAWDLIHKDSGFNHADWMSNFKTGINNIYNIRKDFDQSKIV